jgi:hypothetical protein
MQWVPECVGYKNKRQGEVMKDRKNFTLSAEAIEKLDKIVSASGTTNKSQVLEILISWAYEQGELLIKWDSAD